MGMIARTERAPHETPNTAGNLVAYERYLEEIDKTKTTGWRMRQRGWIETINICGRIYVTRAAIAEFERRAAAGEFAKIHKTPSRASKGGE
jgi:hypothetical protein